MCAERLHFTPGRMDYHALMAAEHISRYAFATRFCKGKRILDVACGEGYGSTMLATEGAANVVGVDNSTEALSVARERFAHEKVRFLEGDALELPGLLAGESPFDVVVSFETIEHIADIARFLDGIRAVLAPDGIVLMSCPNDGLDAQRGIFNPYHTRTYTLAEFQQATTEVLGRADQWYLGTPLQGMLICNADLEALHNTRVDLALMVEARKTVSGQLLPAQRNMMVEAETCSFYVGLWGASGDCVQVTSPMSRQAFLEPWLALDYLKAERGTAQERSAFLESEIGELQNAATGVRERSAFLESEIVELQNATARERERSAFLESEVVDLQRTTAERDRAKEQISFLEQQIGELRRAATVERSGIKRLVQTLESTLRDTESRLRQIEPEFQHALISLRAIQSSRGHRVLQRYYSLAGSRTFGPAVRFMRRAAGRVRRIIRCIRQA